METIRLDTTTGDGRRIALWRSRIHDSSGGPVVVLCPGFGRQMTDLVTVAHYLCTNGATVYRMDPLDHVGLSDGTIFDYTPSASALSLQAVLGFVHRAERGQPVVVVAASMAARPAVRVALEGSIDRLVTVVGVVNMRRTIAAVFGDAIVAMPRAELPRSVWFENLEVGPHGIYDDQRFGWWDLEVTRAELECLAVPTTAIFADGDPWVDADDVRLAFGESGHPNRRLVSIHSSTHDLGQDATAGLIALEAITAAALDSTAVRVPTLEALVASIHSEANLEAVPA